MTVEASCNKLMVKSGKKPVNTDVYGPSDWTECPKVGMTGFEPAASSSRTKRATGLRYIPKWRKYKTKNKKNPGQFRLNDKPLSASAFCNLGITVGPIPCKARISFSV